MYFCLKYIVIVLDRIGVLSPMRFLRRGPYFYLFLSINSIALRVVGDHITPNEIGINFETVVS